MSLVNRLSLAACLCVTLVCLSGCVGPQCYHARGPLSFGGCAECDGCGGDCDGCGECQGCGELYIDPWINHPAECCDPCDKCGNYNGQSCGKCRSVWGGVASLWGYRCDAGCEICGDRACAGGCGVVSEPCCGASCGGCDSCCGDSCGGCDACYSGVGSVGEPVHIVTEPTPAKEIVEAVPAGEPYRPRRVRKIFQPRSQVASGMPRASDY